MKIKEDLSKKEIISKIMEKKEFSKLPKKDVAKVFELFDKEGLVLEDKIKQTRDLLRKMYVVFVSTKLLNKKNESPEWFLKKHISTKERFGYYKELYSRILKPGDTIYDLGAGVNGLSFSYFPKHTRYVGVEAVGQLVELMNFYFKTRGLDAEAIHESLFNLDKIKILLKKRAGTKIIFLFKVLDSLEMLEKNYSKKFLLKVMPLVDKIVVSYATESLVSRKKFFSNRKWLRDFIEEEFKILDSFDLGGEKYIVFSNKPSFS
jgi:hypothetical protein